MIRGALVALIVLTWCDEITNGGRYTSAAFQASRSILHFVFPG